MEEKNHWSSLEFYSVTNEPHYIQEEEFNNGIREITILVLMSMILYFGSYVLLSFLRQKDDEDEFVPNCWEDQIVYKTSFVICVFSLAVSLGASLLLPISTISNEVLHKYPSSWYIKWLNSSLIHGIWNLIFVLSNLSLFVCLPFAYLFCESEGLPFFGHRRGLMARAKETLVTLLLLSLTILGLMYIIAALIDRDRDSIDTILNIYSYLPFLYSCISFLGVLMLLICTPIGFACLFTIVGDCVLKPTFMRNLDEEYYLVKFEEESLKAKMRNAESNRDNWVPWSPIYSTHGKRLKNGELLSYMKENVNELTDKRRVLDRSRKVRIWKRYLGYPLIMLSLLALTSISLICVINNVGQIIAGFRSLPNGHHTLDLGITSLSTMGVVGVVIEVIQIAYLLLTSLVGLYTIPLIANIRPRMEKTTLTHLILNCGLFVILSSALPLLCKILGISNFDLLGSFGEVKWLGNLYIVLFYNAVFAIGAGLCLVTKFTLKVRQEILRRVSMYISTLLDRNFDSSKLGVVTSPIANTSSSLSSSLKLE